MEGEIALIGNPNSGKTTVFNQLTGSRQEVGNWPGKTVEKKEGILKSKGKEYKIVDLPGTYSLQAYTEEEKIARDYILERKADSIVDVMDSTTLEKNLYLAIQLIEMGARPLLVFNMTDIAKRQGLKIDVEMIQKCLQTPVVRTAAREGQGIDDLIVEIEKTTEGKTYSNEKIINYGKEVEEHLIELTRQVEEKIQADEKYRKRWIALKLLEREEILEEIEARGDLTAARKEAERIRKHLEEVFGETSETIIAEARYAFIHGIVQEAVTEPKNRINLTDQIDNVVMNRTLGIPLFLFVMFLVFNLTFTVAGPVSGFLEELFASLGQTGEELLKPLLPSWTVSLLIDGAYTGASTVLLFTPFIFILFFLLSILEDSGYMSRVAFVMDRVMHKIGLHGKSFIPLILGFGCTVPAVMATRVLESRRDRILTILITPFMSCGARLPVYLLFTAVFFPENGDLVVYSLYLLGIAVAIFSGLVLKQTYFKELSTPLVMELPPYRKPTLKGALMHMWEHGILFIKKAGTIIVIASIIIWAMSSFPLDTDYASQESYIGSMGSIVAPALEPLGFGQWRPASSLIFGLGGKEIVVGSMGVLYSAQDDMPDSKLRDQLSKKFTPLSAYSFLVFVLLYVPCAATIAVIRQEIGWRWALFTALYTTGIAWIASFLVYNIGLLLGFS